MNEGRDVCVPGRGAQCHPVVVQPGVWICEALPVHTQMAHLLTVAGGGLGEAETVLQFPQFCVLWFSLCINV